MKYNKELISKLKSINWNCFFFLYLSLSLSLDLFFSLPFILLFYDSFFSLCLSLCLSLSLTLCLSVCLPVCLSVCLSVCISLSLSLSRCLSFSIQAANNLVKTVKFDVKFWGPEKCHLLIDVFEDCQINFWGGKAAKFNGTWFQTSFVTGEVEK